MDISRNFLDLRKIVLLWCVVICLQFPNVDMSSCSDRLVTGPSGVADNHLSSSSHVNPFYSAEQARLNLSRCWITQTTKNAYIQVDFAKSKTVVAIQTKGSKNWNSWVKTYTVSYKTDDWKTITDSANKVKIFSGNKDQRTIVTNVLPVPVVSKSLRIHPQSWHVYIGLRFEVIGCTHVVRPTNWMLHPVIITNQQNSLWNKSATNLGICAQFCYNEPACMSFIFNDDANYCSGFAQEFFYGLRMDTLQGNKYFLGVSTLSDNIEYMTRHGYKQDQNILYKIHTEKKTASSAKHVCRNEATDLFVARNTVMMGILQNAIRNVTTSTNEDYLFYIGGSRINGKWMYSDDIEIPKNLWAATHPKDDASLCVVLSYKGLKTEQCSLARKFVCGF